MAAYKSEHLINKIFVNSWVKNSDIESELIICDNGGNGNALLPYMAHACRGGVEYPGEVKVVGSGKNIGLNAALNECAKVATGEWYYLPHTDMYLMPGWDTALLDAAKNHPPASLLMCSRSIEPTKGHTDFHIIKNYGMEWNEFDEKSLLEDFKDYQDRTICTGARMPFFMHRTLWGRMGGVDSNYFSYCTDDDLIQEAYAVGVRKFWMVYDSLVYHLQGKSNQQQTVDKDSDKPYEYFVDKWKKRGYPDAEHPGQWHPKLIPNYTKVR